MRSGRLNELPDLAAAYRHSIPLNVRPVSEKEAMKDERSEGRPGKAVRRDLLGRDIDRQLVIPHVAHLVCVDFLPEA